jgi:hypothetical protein
MLRGASFSLEFVAALAQGVASQRRRGRKLGGVWGESRRDFDVRLIICSGEES